ncbi:MAG: dimethyladenosine transferase, rRNA (adenine1518-N6/adenine1519-N6)-dimethyltransferase [Candidatus Parcubacteria bacterium]|jgi:16S rRNA (adenine1518-N6/adenine1519-N6)-dimethyltransferase
MQKLGQHFLKDASVLRAIADAISPRPGEIIVEIGPGHGELTKELVLACGASDVGEQQCRIIAIEKDARLGELLQKTFLDDPKVNIVHGDALNLLEEIATDTIPKSTPYAVVGNIPYYITGRLLRVLGELEHKPSRIVLTIQKEVAERIVAEPPCMNRLAAIVQFWAEPRILHIVPRSAFRPEPDVDSAVILLSVKNSIPETVGFPIYTAIVRKLFAQPRKTILNNLRTAAPIEDVERALRTAGSVPQQRPQDLSIQAIATIAEFLFKTPP